MVTCSERNPLSESSLVNFREVSFTDILGRVRISSRSARTNCAQVVAACFSCKVHALRRTAQMALDLFDRIVLCLPVDHGPLEGTVWQRPDMTYDLPNQIER